MIIKTQKYHMLLLAIIVGIGSRIYMNFFVDGFIVTLSVILLGLILYKHEEFSTLKFCIMVAIISPLFRLFTLTISTDAFFQALVHVYPDIIFYISYGIIFTYLMRAEQKNQLTLFSVFYLSDSCSNFLELLVRTSIIHIDASMILGILLIAMLRSSIIMYVITIERSYRHILEKENHEQRYHDLLLQTSKFKSETYFLEKNITQLEKLMKRTYRLYEKLSDDTMHSHLYNDYSKEALDISKDIHEIKKDYLKVIQGLRDVYPEESKAKSMTVSSLFSIIKHSTINQLNHTSHSIYFSGHSNYVFKKHFYLMSILRNLINNAIESLPNNYGIIHVKCSEDDEFIIFEVKDNGMGIKEEYLPHIFEAGYSDKFKEDTGEILRGMGLSIVKSLVENEFAGYVDCESDWLRGSTFRVFLRKEPEGEVLFN